MLNAGQLSNSVSDLLYRRKLETEFFYIHNILKKQIPGLSFTRKIHKSDGSIRWEEPAEILERKIRAYHPWPASTFRITGKNGGIQLVKITEARQVPGCGKPGTTLLCEKRWIVACGRGAIEILRIIPEGSREMNAVDFIRGLGNPGLVKQVFDGPLPPPSEPKPSIQEKKSDS